MPNKMFKQLASLETKKPKATKPTKEHSWHFNPRMDAGSQLYKQFESCSLNWEIVTEDMVVENYNCTNPADKDITVMQVVIRRRETKQHSILIYKLEFVQGWTASYRTDRENDKSETS